MDCDLYSHKNMCRVHYIGKFGKENVSIPFILTAEASSFFRWYNERCCSHHLSRAPSKVFRIWQIGSQQRKNKTFLLILTHSHSPKFACMVPQLNGRLSILGGTTAMILGGSNPQIRFHHGCCPSESGQPH